MKYKFSVLALSALLCFLLALGGCTRAEKGGQKTKSLTLGSQPATIVFSEESNSEGTIETSQGSYRFWYEPDGSLNILYPNGAQVTVEDGLVLADLDFSPMQSGYLDAFSMTQAIEDAAGVGKSTGPSGFLALLLMAGGLWAILRPQHLWYLSHGWQYENAQPSQAALTAYVLGGAAITVFGFLLLLQ